jgi:hypothetical protein
LGSGTRAKHLTKSSPNKEGLGEIPDMVNGRQVTNRDALVNPESLDYLEKILPELR